MVTAKRYMMISAISGVVFAVATGAFLWGVRAETAQAVRGDGGLTTVTVLVATADLKPGDQLTARNTKTSARRVDSLPDGAVVASERATVLGKRVGELILSGEPIVGRRVSGEPSRLDSVAEGFAAVTLGADPVRALGGEVNPGMRVALLTTSIAGDIVTLGEDVEVLSVSNQSARGQSNGGTIAGTTATGGDITWVTVAVREEAVAAVVRAAQSNTVYLVRYGAAENGAARG